MKKKILWKLHTYFIILQSWVLLQYTGRSFSLHNFVFYVFSLHNFGFSRNRMDSTKIEQHFSLVTNIFLFMLDWHKTFPGMQINPTMVQARHIENQPFFGHW